MTLTMAARKRAWAADEASGAGRLLGGWAERGLLPAGRAALAKVNVDEAKAVVRNAR